MKFRFKATLLSVAAITALTVFGGQMTHPVHLVQILMLHHQLQLLIHQPRRHHPAHLHRLLLRLVQLRVLRKRRQARLRQLRKLLKRRQPRRKRPLSVTRPSINHTTIQLTCVSGPAITGSILVKPKPSILI